MPSTRQDFATPMMQQYLKLKKAYSDCILFFRLGDFYEMFLDDAELGSQILGITLTSRSRGKDGRIPMAGVPYHAVNSYLNKLVRAGHKVAICDQVSEPDGKGLVERKVVRIVTPGTILDETSLDSKHQNYVLFISYQKKQLGLAAADVSTGNFLASQLEINSTSELEQTLSNTIARLQPAEIILEPKAFENSDLKKILERHQIPLFPFQDWAYFKRQAKPTLLDHFQIKSLASLGIAKKTKLQETAAVLIGYLNHTQQTVVPHLTSLKPLLETNHLQLDRSTIANLELLETLSDGHTQGSLLSFLDKTQTAMGARLLKQWLLQPLTNKKEIEARHDAIEELVAKNHLQKYLSQDLKQIHDLERLLSRLTVNLGTPRDLKNLEQSLAMSTNLTQHLDKSSSSLLKGSLKSLNDKQIKKLHLKISQTIKSDPPNDPKQGGFIEAGINKQIDQLNHTISTNREWMISLENKEKTKTGISSLKIRFNKVFGFYIEVSKSNLSSVPKNYIRRQTLVNAERFITPEMKEREDIILQAEETIQKLEYQEFLNLVGEVLSLTRQIQTIAKTVAQIDCLVSLTQVAQENNFCRPTMVTTGQIDIEGGFHPTVANQISNHLFVPNDTHLDQGKSQVMVITGPNMAGKSVLMRQVAVITLLSHLGSFVPARKATISIVDSIFVRSGATDSITSGLSTFMVEMVETAYILSHATDKSLVIMDEIGRGTSTYDGISIAWAIAERLVQKNKPNPKTLFATHYHELQELADHHPQKIKNYHLAVTGGEKNPTFLYSLTEGAASHSYGVAVAALAGVPSEVTTQARKLLHQLENQKSNQVQVDELTKKSNQKKPTNSVETNHKLLKKLRSLEIEKLTPLEALNLLYQWQQKYDKPEDTNEK